MTSAARVLIVGDSKTAQDDIAGALHQKGFESYTGDITQSAAELTGRRRPDIVILNMDSSEAQNNPRAFLALAQTLKESALASRMRIMLVGGERELSLNGEASAIDDLLLGPVQSTQICHRIKSLVRLNTMHEELVRRLNTSAKYGVDAPEPVAPPRQIDNAKVLFLGDAASFGLAENAIAKKATLVGALTFTTAMDYLAREQFDMILMDVGGNPESGLTFVEELRRNSRMFNMPVLMLAEDRAIDSPKQAYESGVTDILLKPVAATELQMRAYTLIREQRFRGTLRHVYTAAKHFATNDSLTGLYNRGFLLEHLAQIIADTERTSQTFSLATFSIKNIEEINALMGYAGGDRVIRQIGEVIGYLVRGEDLATRYAGHKFVIVLPDTP
ncbi:MAG: diguanylate cyclase, partial [Methyloligellaceae bacterium]